MGHSDGKETIRSAITMLNDMDRILNQKIVFEETESGWRESLAQVGPEVQPSPGGLITGICSSHIAYEMGMGSIVKFTINLSLLSEYKEENY